MPYVLSFRTDNKYLGMAGIAVHQLPWAMDPDAAPTGVDTLSCFP